MQITQHYFACQQNILQKNDVSKSPDHGWDLAISSPDKGCYHQYDNTYDFAAMVPYQVYHTLNALDKIKKLIIGGGVIDPD